MIGSFYQNFHEKVEDVIGNVEKASEKGILVKIQ